MRSVACRVTGRRSVVATAALAASPVANTPGVRRQVYELMRYQDEPPEEAGCIDLIGMIYHGFTITHIDALCHIFTPAGRQGMYNGFPISAVTPIQKWNKKQMAR